MDDSCNSEPGDANDDGSASRQSKQGRSNESRKEQNRAASRKYRQRRKRRLAMLDQLLASTELETPGADNCGEGIEGPIPLENDASDQNAPLAAPIEGFVTADLTVLATTSSTDVSTLDSSFQQDGAWSLDPSLTYALFDTSIPLDESTNIQAESSSFTSGLINLDADPTFQHWSALSVPLVSDQMPSFHQTPLTAPAQDTHSTQDTRLSGVIESLRGLSVAQKHQVMALLKVELDHGAAQGQNRTTSNSATPSPSKAAFNALIRIKTEAKGYESWLSGVLASNLLSLPDPKLNSIRIIRSSFYAAILANSIAIGLFNYEVLDEDGLSPYSIDHETGHPPSQVASARVRFAARTPQSLAPSDGQLTFPHHPYLDVIPFGEFRQRAIAALSCDPPLFDEEELCHDFDAEGLVCWGSQPADAGRRGIETEVPWDPRSWEPQAWFLKKYWFLVGGSSGEMHTCAKLWADRRGKAI